MKLIRIGSKYQVFLEQGLKQYNYIRGQDGFNCSMTSLNGIDGLGPDDYLCYIRCLGLLPAYFGEEIVPGNYSGKMEYIKSKMIKDGEDVNSVKFGQNFFWNNWTDSSIVDNAIFFVAKINGDVFEPITTIKPIAFRDIPIFYKGKLLPYKFSDIRFIRTNDKRILIHGGFVSAIFEIVVDKGVIYTSIIMDLKLPIYKKHTFYFNRGFCDNIRENDKNWAFIETLSIKVGGRTLKGGKDATPHFSFLNWYENKSISMTILPVDSKQKNCMKKYIIKQEGDVITGLDKNFEIGMFSFGTPFAPIISSPEVFEGIAAGHIKIIHNAEYNNKRIKTFIASVRKLEKDVNFITHSSYYYLTYFIHLKRIGTNYEMKISNAFLFIPKDITKYKFSINFPMSCNLRDGDKTAMFSLGIGDFYTYNLYMNTADVIKECKHNVAKFNIKKYEYIIKNV
jgi:hypothetical protein